MRIRTISNWKLFRGSARRPYPFCSLLFLGVRALSMQAQESKPEYPVQLIIKAAQGEPKQFTVDKLPFVSYRLKSGVENIETFWTAAIEYEAPDGQIKQTVPITGSKPFKLTGPSGNLPWDAELEHKITAKSLISAIPDFQNIKGDYKVDC